MRQPSAEDVTKKWWSLSVEQRQECMSFEDAELTSQIIRALQHLFVQQSCSETSGTESFQSSSLMSKAFVFEAAVSGTDGKRSGTMVMKMTISFANKADFFEQLKAALPDALSPKACSRRSPMHHLRWKQLWAKLPQTVAECEERLVKTMEQALWAMCSDPRLALPAAADKDAQAQVLDESWMLEEKHSCDAKGAKKPSKSQRQKKRMQAAMHVYASKTQSKDTSIEAGMHDQDELLLLPAGRFSVLAETESPMALARTQPCILASESDEVRSQDLDRLESPNESIIQPFVSTLPGEHSLLSTTSKGLSTFALGRDDICAQVTESFTSDRQQSSEPLVLPLGKQAGRTCSSARFHCQDTPRSCPECSQERAHPLHEYCGFCGCVLDKFPAELSLDTCDISTSTSARSESRCSQDSQFSFGKVVVKNHFIEVSDGPDLRQRFSMFRKSKTFSHIEERNDNSIAQATDYEPGSFADLMAAGRDEVEPHSPSSCNYAGPPPGLVLPSTPTPMMHSMHASWPCFSF